MYDINLRRVVNTEINNARDLAYFLLENCPDAKVAVLGDPNVYIHVEEDRSVVSFDDNSMSDLTEYNGNDECEEIDHVQMIPINQIKSKGEIQS